MYDNIKSVVSPRDVLNKLGRTVIRERNTECLSPDHNDGNPSCHVYPDHVHCFSCGWSADIFKMVQANTGCGFWASVEYICREFEQPLPERDPELERIRAAQEEISAIYNTIWTDAGRDMEPALDYLESRGIARDVAEKYVGSLPPDYTPTDRDGAKLAGLYRHNKPFPLAGRVVIPITRYGQIVSIYGRAIADCEVDEHHLLSGKTDPTMPVGLWNLDRLTDRKNVYLCESIIDALTLVAHGFPAIAIQGCNKLNKDHTTLMKRCGVQNVALCFDTDVNDAGQNAALKAAKLIFRAGLDGTVITLPRENGGVS